MMRHRRPEWWASSSAVSRHRWGWPKRSVLWKKGGSLGEKRRIFWKDYPKKAARCDLDMKAALLIRSVCCMRRGCKTIENNEQTPDVVRFTRLWRCGGDLLDQEAEGDSHAAEQSLTSVTWNHGKWVKTAVAPDPPGLVKGRTWPKLRVFLGLGCALERNPSKLNGHWLPSYYIVFESLKLGVH